MKRFLTLALGLSLAMGILSGCGKTSEDGESGTDEIVLEEKSEDDIVSEEEDATAFDRFFDCYADTELAESITKDKHVVMNMFAETDHPYVIDSNTHIAKVKDGEGDNYKANFVLDDTVAGNSSLMEASYADGFLYYALEDKLYKQSYEWSDVKYMIDGYYFKLYEYTVSEIHTTNYKDGSQKLEFTFNLQNLAEAPDEEIFEILSVTGTTYKNLAFNEASFVGYIDADGYVTGYEMYYDGQVYADSDVFTFKYTTTVQYSDINKTEIEIPDNPDDYELVETEAEEETNQ